MKTVQNTRVRRVRRTSIEYRKTTKKYWDKLKRRMRQISNYLWGRGASKPGAFGGSSERGMRKNPQRGCVGAPASGFSKHVSFEVNWKPWPLIQISRQAMSVSFERCRKGYPKKTRAEKNHRRNFRKRPKMTEAEIRADVFRPEESDLDYFLRRKRELNVG